MPSYYPRKDKEKESAKSRFKNIQRILDEKEQDWRIQKILLFVAIFILLGVTIAVILLQKPAESEQQEKQTSDVITPSQFIISQNAKTLKVPAVDNQGKGVPVRLRVEANQGTGRILVDVESLFFFVDTQNSVRNARNVAAKISGLDPSKHDVLYVVEANASAIGGPSAGAALTIATVAALKNLTLRDDVMITGSINHDGTLGPVSGIIEKATAAKQVGAVVFIVPLTQGIEVTYETQRYCEKIGPAEVCTVEQIPKKVSVEQEVGIKIVEAVDVSDALKYFTAVG